MKQAFLSLFAYSLFFVWAFDVHAQDFQIRHISTKNGLAGPRINTLLQDQRGFLWVGTGNGLQCFDGYTFHTYEHIPGYDLSLQDNYIRALFEDKTGNLWIGTDLGLHAFDWTTESFTFIPFSESAGEMPDYSVNDLFEDRQGRLWVGTYSGLFLLNRESGHILPVEDPSGANCAAIIAENTILEDLQGKIWIGTAKGLYRFDPDAHSYQHYFNSLDSSKEFQFNLVQALFEEKKNQFLIGTRQGLFLFDREKERFSPYSSGSHPPLSQAITTIAGTPTTSQFIGTFGKGLLVINRTAPESSENDFSTLLSTLRIETVLPDDHGNIWVGTYGNGLYQLSQVPPIRQFHPPAMPGGGTSGRRVRSFFERTDGTILLGVDGGGVQIFDPVTESFLTTDQPKSLSNARVYAAIEDQQGKIWVATMGSGVHWYDPADPETHYRHFDLPLRCEDIYEDQQGYIWIVSREVFCRFHPEGDTFTYFRKIDEPAGPFAHTAVSFVFEDEQGQLWAGTEKGLFYLDRELDSFEYLTDTLANQEGMKSLSITQDLNGKLWIGGKSEIRLVNPLNKQVLKAWNRSNGFPEQMALGLEVDNKGFLWIATNKGLYRFDPRSGMFRKYDRGVESPVENYNSTAALKSTNGTLYFGHQNGFDLIQPDQIEENTHPPPVAITSFHLSYRKVPISGTLEDTFAVPSPLNRHIAASDELRLKHWQNDFSFEFAALDFSEPLKNRYRYKLEPYHKDWVETSADQRQAVFTNLSPGRYRFHVIGSNNHGYWNPEGDTLYIKIFYPWWATPWAYAFYVLSASSLFVLIYSFHLKRNLAAAEASRLRELDTFKSRLYTNITHEFRTPLTVILGMTERLSKNASESHLRSLEMIKRNGFQLLRLVNQMLDLRKVESGHLSLSLVQADVVAYVRYLGSSLHSFAEIKGITPHFNSELPELITDFDPEKLKMVITNLYSNAIKFTHSGGKVFLEIARAPENPNKYEIRVRDSGIGIPTNQIPYIFDRFYQYQYYSEKARQGTGIGLTLTKELVNLFGGTIEVQSETGKGSLFTVCLPISQKAPVAAVPFTLEEWTVPLIPGILEERVEFEPSFSDKSFPIALVIEDNPDVVRYLKECLKPTYQIFCAPNGREGIEKAITIIPDIIISDVMMPEKDGYEVCDVLKDDERTSHIPIILLTAKADALSRIKGLQKGADAYLSKPFNEQELQVRLEKLIELRRKLRERYQNLQYLPPSEDPAFVKEDTFLSKLRATIETHLDDTSYGPSVLASEMGLSHSQLFRKTKSLTGKSIAGYIRLIRLQKAKELIQKSDLNISEVAYQVGFSSPAYFSRTFQKEFGESPSSKRREQKT